MKGNAKDYVSIAQQFFTAHDAHDVDGMLGLCADGALGRYAPYGRESVVPIRGGIDVIWRASPNAVPIFCSRRTHRQFRLGKDELLVARDGQSRISTEDFAIALVDELEEPKHSRQRFTVGY
jgi:hypothetical protein